MANVDAPDPRCDRRRNRTSQRERVGTRAPRALLQAHRLLARVIPGPYRRHPRTMPVTTTRSARRRYTACALLLDRSLGETARGRGGRNRCAGEIGLAGARIDAHAPCPTATGASRSRHRRSHCRSAVDRATRSARPSGARTGTARSGSCVGGCVATVVLRAATTAAVGGKCSGDLYVCRFD